MKTAKTTKTQAICEAMRVIGENAKPKDLISFVKKIYGMDVKYNSVSACKSFLRKKEIKSGINFDDIMQVKKLIVKFGAEDVKKLVDVVS